jgi:hypothetical protein
MIKFLVQAIHVDADGEDLGETMYYKLMEWPAVPRKDEMFDPCDGTYYEVLMVWHDAKHNPPHIMVSVAVHDGDYERIGNDSTWSADRNQVLMGI